MMESWIYGGLGFNGGEKVFPVSLIFKSLAFYEDLDALGM